MELNKIKRVGEELTLSYTKTDDNGNEATVVYRCSEGVANPAAWKKCQAKIATALCNAIGLDESLIGAEDVRSCRFKVTSGEDPERAVIVTALVDCHLGERPLNINAPQFEESTAPELVKACQEWEKLAIEFLNGDRQQLILFQPKA